MELDITFSFMRLELFTLLVQKYGFIKFWGRISHASSSRTLNTDRSKYYTTAYDFKS
jgi:hypothetical protein